MKRVLLICPDGGNELEGAVLGETPVLGEFLGKPLLDHVLDRLAAAGAQDVRLLVCHRPAEVRAHVAGGESWGLKLEVIPEPAELAPGVARRKHSAFRPDLVTRPADLFGEEALLRSARGWHHAQRALLPLLAGSAVGAREVEPGVWLGHRAVVDPAATLVAPCWIGSRSMVGAGAVIGPDAFLERGCFVDRGAIVERSSVTAHTYLGRMVHVRGSLAGPGVLLNWNSGSRARVSDAFLVGATRRTRKRATNCLSRVTALAVLLLTLPLLMWAGVLALVRRAPLWKRGEAVLPSTEGRRNTIGFRDLAPLRSGWRRWPRLWRVVTGHFAWTGNPPLPPEAAAKLENEFERLWTEIPPGVFTAPEAAGCEAPWSEEAFAHAALFVRQPTAQWRRKIVGNAIRGLFGGPGTPTGISL